MILERGILIEFYRAVLADGVLHLTRLGFVVPACVAIDLVEKIIREQFDGRYLGINTQASVCSIVLSCVERISAMWRFCEIDA